MRSCFIVSITHNMFCPPFVRFIKKSYFSCHRLLANSEVIVVYPFLKLSVNCESFYYHNFSNKFQKNIENVCTAERSTNKKYLHLRKVSSCRHMSGCQRVVHIWRQLESLAVTNEIK